MNAETVTTIGREAAAEAGEMSVVETETARAGEMTIGAATAARETCP